MILYRKSAQLRLKRNTAPEPPFQAAAVVSPYGPRRSEPVAIDYPALRATAVERAEVPVCEDVYAALQSARFDATQLPGSVLIDATGLAETTFRRGNETLEWCREMDAPAILLVSDPGALPERTGDGEIVAISAWPPRVLEPVLESFAEAAARGLRWGAFIPIIYPLTTETPALERIADAAQEHGARFLACSGIEADATARQVFARQMQLTADDDRWAMLFHSRIEPLQLAAERHVAALADERGLADVVIPPLHGACTNWNAAALLTLTAARMLGLELDLDLAGRIARSARAVAELDRPLTRIAESASLAIIGALDETSVEMLAEWLETGRAAFAAFVDEQWRLKRG